MMSIFPDYLTHISMPQFLNILSNIQYVSVMNGTPSFLNITCTLVEFSHLFQPAFKG